MKVRIEITKGPDSGRNFVLEPNEKRIIGRGEDVQIRMKDELISREHCEIEFNGKILILRDLGSTNSTFIQKNLNEPISPDQSYPIENQTSFFVGPESRFLVVYEEDPEESVQTPGQKHESSAGNSNFSNSLVSPANRGPVFGGDSSIFHLTGPVSDAPGLDDVGHPPKPTPKHPDRPDRGAASPRPKPTVYDSNSIVPPGQQGLESVAFRDQVKDGDYVDESHLKSTPSVVERTQDQPESPPQQRPESNPAPPAKQMSPLGSLVPPAQQSKDQAAKDQKPKRIKPDTTPVSYPPVDDKENVSTHSPFDSIASPGLAYPDRMEPGPPTPAASQNLAEPQIDERTPSESAAKAHPNGLYFHRGKQIEHISKIITEIGEKLSPVFCADLTRIGLSTRQTGTGNDSSESNFDLEEGAGTVPDSPFDPTSSADEIVGVPLFDFLPKELRQSGPRLITRDQFDLSLEESWHQDGIVVFFGKDIGQMMDHLKKLISTNILNGKPSRSMFGFCWPSVLYPTLESQPAETVARVFGDCISCIIVEDPSLKFDWTVISQSDLSQEIASLGKN